MKDFYFLDKIFLQLNLLASTMFSKTADWIGEKDAVRSTKTITYKVFKMWLVWTYFSCCRFFQLVNWKVQVQSISCWNKWTGENWVILQIQNSLWNIWKPYFRVTCTKYTDMRQVTQNVSKGVSDQWFNIQFHDLNFFKVSDLNNKYAELQPFLEQIDQIDESVSRSNNATCKSR